MDKVDIVIIGAGIIGLAVAERLSRVGKDIIVLEKEESFGRHTSSRNSEVIHSGVYYQRGSLKAELCLRGNSALYSFLEKYGIPHKRCGKLVVAAETEQESALHGLWRNGLENGVEGLEILSSRQFKKRTPLFKGIRALWVPSTGIMDSHRVMKTLAGLAGKNGALFSYKSEVKSIQKTKDGYILSLKGMDYKLCSRTVINAAGLWSDRIAAMTGMDPDTLDYTLHWNKGEYYKTSRYRNVEHLIYPLPDPRGGHLGIHTVSNLDGELSFGPNTYYVDKIDYSVDETHHQVFYKSISRYLDIAYEDIWPGSTGIRPKLQAAGEPERDFIISHEADKGFPRFINLIGIDSPGLTCCLPIADYVASLLAL